MDEPMIYGQLAIDAHDAKIRAEAMRYALDLICSEFIDQDPVFQKEIDNFIDHTAPRLRYVIEAAILTREVKE